jgi:hypothetical protein
MVAIEKWPGAKLDMWGMGVDERHTVKRITEFVKDEIETVFPYQDVFHRLHYVRDGSMMPVTVTIIEPWVVPPEFKWYEEIDEHIIRLVDEDDLDDVHVVIVRPMFNSEL